MLTLFSYANKKTSARMHTHTYTHRESHSVESLLSDSAGEERMGGGESQRGRAHESSLILTGRVCDSDAYAMSKCKRVA